MKHDERVLDEVLTGRRGAYPDPSAMLRFHKGEPPCAAYGGIADVGDAERAEIRAELSRAGLLGRVEHTGLILWRWGHEDERERHGPITDDELLASWNATANVHERIVAALASGRLAKVLRRNNDERERANDARADGEIAGLSDEEQAALRATWVRRPRALSFPAAAGVVLRLTKERGEKTGDDMVTGIAPSGPVAPPRTQRAKQCRDFMGGLAAEMQANHTICVQACDEGDMPSCAIAALGLDTGVMGTRDPRRAIALYEKACASREAPLSCAFLGSMFDDGVYVARDSRAAAGARERGCQQGDQMSCDALNGVRDMRKTVGLYERDGGKLR